MIACTICIAFFLCLLNAIGCAEPTSQQTHLENAEKNSVSQVSSQSQPSLLEGNAYQEALQLVGLHCGTWSREEKEVYVRTLLNRRDILRPSFAAILVDPNSDPVKVACTFTTLLNTDTCDHKFLELAVKRLADESDRVRHSALCYLERYGKAENTQKITAMLADTDTAVRYAAAKTLAAIGGQRDLDAMDAWLKDGKHPNDADYLIHVKKCRDELEKRVKANPPPSRDMME